MKKIIAIYLMSLLFAAGVASAAGTAPAAAAEPGIGLTLKAGTTGLGGELTYGLTENLNLRGGIGVFSWTLHMLENGTDMKDLKVDLLNIPLTLDWHPITGNGFRISAGVMFNNDRGELSAAAGESVSLNDHEYIVSDLHGKVTFNSVGPYLGIGYGNAADTSSHFHICTDLGVVYIGAPKISLDATAQDPSQQDALNSDIAAQLEKYRHDFKAFQFYPVLAIGISYTF